MKKISIINFSLLLPLIMADILFIISRSLIAKSIASMIFVVIGFINLLHLLKVENKKSLSAYLLFLGLCFACLGDIVLEINFVIGAGLFAVGHVFYFFSYTQITKTSWKDFIYASAIFVPSLLVILLVPIFDFGGVFMQVVCCAYALIISLMLGKAISNYTQNRSILNLVIMLGSILFYFSDFMLLFNVFSNIKTSIFIVLCLTTYYPAEFLLAYSITKQK